MTNESLFCCDKQREGKLCRCGTPAYSQVKTGHLEQLTKIADAALRTHLQLKGRNLGWPAMRSECPRCGVPIFTGEHFKTEACPWCELGEALGEAGMLE
jgi:ribosomal protein S27AE